MLGLRYAVRLRLLRSLVLVLLLAPFAGCPEILGIETRKASHCCYYYCYRYSSHCHSCYYYYWRHFSSYYRTGCKVWGLLSALIVQGCGFSREGFWQPSGLEWWVV